MARTLFRESRKDRQKKGGPQETAHNTAEKLPVIPHRQIEAPAFLQRQEHPEAGTGTIWM